MKINANEIESIEDAGEMASAPVRMIRTKGGLWIAVGTPKGKMQEEALAAGSHPAIVRYSVEKKYPDFHPSLQKSEAQGQNLKVMRHSHFLSDSLRKSGFDIHSLESAIGVDFVVTQHGVTKGTLKALKKGENLEFVTADGINSLGPDAQKIMSKVISEKAQAENVAMIRFKGSAK